MTYKLLPGAAVFQILNGTSQHAESCDPVQSHMLIACLITPGSKKKITLDYNFFFPILSTREKFYFSLKTSTSQFPWQPCLRWWLFEVT